MTDRTRALRWALLAMGYVEGDPGLWSKPFGYILLGYSEAKDEWYSIFARHDDDKPACMERKSMAEHKTAEAFLEAIQQHECYTHQVGRGRKPSRFHRNVCVVE